LIVSDGLRPVILIEMSERMFFSM